MKTAYEVIAQNSVCVDYDDGRSVSFPSGSKFWADSKSKQIVRLLRSKNVREVGPFEAKPPDVVVGLSPAHQSLMNVHEARKKAFREAKAVSATSQKKGEVVQAPPKPPAATKDKK